MKNFSNVLLIVANILLITILWIIISGKNEKSQAIVSQGQEEIQDASIEPQNETEAISDEHASWFVSPKGSDNNKGSLVESPFKSIQKAIEVAQPGDVIELSEGVYMQDVATKRSGTTDAQITIRGPQDAVIKGGGSGRIFEINHDHIVLYGFTIDGQWNSSDEMKSYRDKLLYVHGKEKKNGVNGVRILNMTFKNGGGECIRLRYYTSNNEIANNTIKNCGVHDFKFDEGGKNGEGIYIGTAPEQRSDGKNPTTDPDESNGNWVHHNVFDTQGNECVDIKESSTKNIIEYNQCTGQKDIESGGMDSRGENNIFRYNTITGNSGAGIRFGGDEKNDGIGNQAYANTIQNNKAGGIKFQRMPQGKICGNIMSGNTGGNSVGTYGSRYNPTSACK